MRTHSSNNVVEITSEELKPGIVGDLFHQGARAVQLKEDERIAALWSGLVSDTAMGGGKPFWENGMVDFARNHRAKQMDVGDLWRFNPGTYGHIARKILLYRESPGSALQVLPRHFWSGNRCETLPEETLEYAWELGSDVWRATLPYPDPSREYAVSLELLKYPDCLPDLEAIFSLASDMSGGWSQLGKRVDAYKSIAQGPLDTWITRDLFALGSLVPGLRSLLHALNRSMGRFARYQQPPQRHLIGKPHTDKSRAVTCVCGDRDRIATEIFDGEQWHKLGYTTDSMFILPANWMSRQLGFEPTVHRYSIDRSSSIPKNPRPNVTMMLGVVDRAEFHKAAQLFH